MLVFGLRSIRRDFAPQRKYSQKPLSSMSENSQNAASLETGAKLRLENGLLIFTGVLNQPDVDWIQVVREERNDEVAGTSPGGVSGS